jgi:hypothetical protein
VCSDKIVIFLFKIALGAVLIMFLQFFYSSVQFLLRKIVFLVASMLYIIPIAYERWGGGGGIVATSASPI